MTRSYQLVCMIYELSANLKFSILYIEKEKNLNSCHFERFIT